MSVQPADGLLKDKYDPLLLTSPLIIAQKIIILHTVKI